MSDAEGFAELLRRLARRSAAPRRAPATGAEGPCPNVVDLLRCVLSRDLARYERQRRTVNERGWADYANLVTAAFVVATNRTFGPDCKQVEIDEFVARLRAEAEPEALPEWTGVLVAAALDRAEMPSDIDPEAMFEIEFHVLLQLVTALELPPAGLDALLAEAADRAAWVTVPPRE